MSGRRTGKRAELASARAEQDAVVTPAVADAHASVTDDELVEFIELSAADLPAAQALGSRPAWRPEWVAHNVDDAAVRGPLTDVRGARGRARAVRDATNSWQPVDQAMFAGQRPVHRAQLGLFDTISNEGRP